VDRDDRRCNSRFRLDRMDQAMCVCFGSYYACPMYHRLNGEIKRAEAAAADEPSRGHPPLIMVTANGCELPLLATGT
jgi:hypothetical protein